MRWLVLVALVACKSPEQHAPPAPAKYAVLPDVISSQLGTVGFVLAFDFHSVQTAKIDSLLPADPPCVREIARTANILAVTQSATDWQGYLTGVAAPTLRSCAEALAPGLGSKVTPHGDDSALDIAGTPAIVHTTDTLTTITQGSNAPHAGEPPTVITDLLARVPRDAKGLLVSSGFPDYKLKDVVAYLQTTDTVWTFTVFADAATADAVKPWLESIVRGFRETAKQKGVVASDDWFKIEATPMAGKLVMTIPISALAGAS